MRHIGRLHWFTHSQDLCREDGKGGKNGRAWLHLYWGDPDRDGRKLTCFGIQWVLSRRQHSIGASLDIGGGDGDRDVYCSFRVPGFGVYLSAEDIWPCKWVFYNPRQKYPSSRELSITWHDAALWISIFRDPDEGYGRGGPSFWKDARSAQRHIVIHPLDILLGRTHCKTEKLDAAPAVVQLPEGEYPVNVTIERRVWRRKRWPGVWRQRVNATVESETGLPIPGKGENSYDCDDDAYFSIGTPETTVAGAVAYAAARVQETRQRYGGRDWRPVKA